ncbi:signal transduction histidine kinase [Mobilisporobacter senegalensis]|uniref:histidine kinase n=1 Tax=Mobilisporobacter senegalensis TaxID=1329262 RepID=A0A3N1XI82_9FIRM|nr:HAMP domain-containing sensor histidine kinase [Mobilisporobacter senegalensis]ROR25798.1 signal transduction histidine kinase [Mobilisporobacter senegalensis]
MKISIKIKFSLFLAVLLLLVVSFLSLLVLRGIKNNQQNQYEQYLAGQAKTANTYFIQSILSEENKVPQTFLSVKGQEFARELELITGLSLVLYDRQGELVSKKVTDTESDNIKKTLDYARNNKTAYLTEGDSLYYLAPLIIGNEQVGVVQFYYSLSGHQEFYNNIRRLFIYIGAGLFILSFFLGNIYYNSFAAGIIKLNDMVDKIRGGHYETTVLKRRDEIGTLSQGIHEMSGQIMRTIQGMEAEQNKLKLAVDKLSLLDKQQKEFIGNVTHEFKTPLTSIKAYIDLLEMYPDDEELLQTSIANIKSETGRLYEMVDKVLQLSALEKYDFELKFEKLPVKQATESVLNSLKGRMDKFGIELNTELNEAYIEGDKDSLTIVLINLLDNAIKYNKTNGTIFVRTYISFQQVYIEISDTGIGIPAKLIHKVFEPFYTVDKNRARENGGAGLGLSLARKHAELMGGTIALLNTGMEGTSFRVTFPAVLN